MNKKYKVELRESVSEHAKRESVWRSRVRIFIILTIFSLGMIYYGFIINNYLSIAFKLVGLLIFNINFITFYLVFRDRQIFLKTYGYVKFSN